MVIMPFLMPTRNESVVFFDLDVEAAPIDAEIARLRERLCAVIHATDTHVCVPLQGSGTFGGESVFASCVPRDGKIAVMTFHGVPDIKHPWVNTDPAKFESYLQHLKDTGCKVIALRELAAIGYPHIYREHEREHPMAGGHFFPREELPDLVAWFNAQHRNPLPAALTVVREASHFQPFGWVRIDTTDPIAVFADDLVSKRDELTKKSCVPESGSGSEPIWLKVIGCIESSNPHKPLLFAFISSTLN